MKQVVTVNGAFVKELKISYVFLCIATAVIVALGFAFYQIMCGGQNMAVCRAIAYTGAIIIPVSLFFLVIGRFSKIVASPGRMVFLSFFYCLASLGSFLATTQGWSMMFMLFCGLIFFAGLFILLLIIILFKNKDFSVPTGLVIAILSIQTAALLLNNGDAGDNGGMCTFIEILTQKALFCTQQNSILLAFASKIIYALSLLSFIGWMNAYKVPNTTTVSLPEPSTLPQTRPDPVPRVLSIILMSLVGIGAAYVTGLWLYSQANPTDPTAQWKLGESYAKQGGEANDKEAVKWLTKAADGRLMNAFYPLGTCLVS